MFGVVKCCCCEDDDADASSFFVLAWFCRALLSRTDNIERTERQHHSLSLSLALPLSRSLVHAFWLNAGREKTTRIFPFDRSTIQSNILAQDVSVSQIITEKENRKHWTEDLSGDATSFSPRPWKPIPETNDRSIIHYVQVKSNARLFFLSFLKKNYFALIMTRYDSGEKERKKEKPMLQFDLGIFIFNREMIDRYGLIRSFLFFSLFLRRQSCRSETSTRRSSQFKLQRLRIRTSKNVTQWSDGSLSRGICRKCSSRSNLSVRIVDTFSSSYFSCTLNKPSHMHRKIRSISN